MAHNCFCGCTRMRRHHAESRNAVNQRLMNEGLHGHSDSLTGGGTRLVLSRGSLGDIVSAAAAWTGMRRPIDPGRLTMVETANTNPKTAAYVRKANTNAAKATVTPIAHEDPCKPRESSKDTKPRTAMSPSAIRNVNWGSTIRFDSRRAQMVCKPEVDSPADHDSWRRAGILRRRLAAAGGKRLVAGSRRNESTAG